MFLGQYPNNSQQTIVLGAHTEKRDIIEAFHQHISWPAMRDWDKTVQQKAQGVRFKVPTSKHSSKGGKKIWGKKKKKNQQCHNLCINDYKASSTTELLLEDVLTA